MTAQVFIPTSEFVIPAGTQTNEANAENKTESATVESKTSKCLTLIRRGFLRNWSDINVTLYNC